VSTPEERVELFLDANEQTDEWNRAMREEERDGAVLWHPSDDQPSPAELAQMAAWDRAAEKRDREAGR